MTTWDNTDITTIDRNTHGKLKERIYTIAGISGDTGGTLTVTGFSNIKFADVHAYQATTQAPADVDFYISSNTIVVTYTDPTAAHTVIIQVIGY